MAVQLTGLIEWLPGWLVLRMDCLSVFPGSTVLGMGWIQYFQDPGLLEGIVFIRTHIIHANMGETNTHITNI